MWDSPSWLGTAIRAKVDKQIAEENRASTEDIATLNRQSNETIADLNRRSNEAIAQANRENQASIAELDRAARAAIAEDQIAATRYGIDVQASTAAAQRILDRELTDIRIASNERIAANELSSREGIAAADRESRERINAVNIQANLFNEAKRRELTASEGLANRELTAAEGKANRENQMDIAKLNVAQRVASDGIRLIPYAFNNSSDFRFKGGAGTGSSAPVVGTVTSDTAKSKADALFPDLEPTFKSKGTALGLIGAMLVSGLSGFASFVPFI